MTSNQSTSSVPFSIKNFPAGPAIEMRKVATIRVVYMKEPFYVETQEGIMYISPETCDDWQNGYYIAYPSDGSKPYAISPQFIADNYVTV